MANREIIFQAMPGSSAFGKELHFILGDNNCVRWQVVPRGEQGFSLPFENLREVERFVQNHARRLGFTRRLEDTNSELPT